MLSLFVNNGYAAPTRGFFQEYGAIAEPGSIYVDLYNSTGMWTRQANSQLRVALPRSEVWVGPDVMGFKVGVRHNIAAYSDFKFTSSSGEASEFDVGVAYVLPSPYAYINLAPQIEHKDSLTHIVMNGAIFFNIVVPRWMGRFQAGGEFAVSEQTGAPTGIGAGVRWIFRDTLTIDLMFIGDGGNATQPVIRTPAALRLNLGL